MVARLIRSSTITEWGEFLRTKTINQYGNMGNGVFCVMYNDISKSFSFNMNHNVGGGDNRNMNPVDVRKVLNHALTPHIGLENYNAQDLLDFALEQAGNNNARFTCAEHLLLASWLILHRGQAYQPGSLTFLATLRNATNVHLPISPCAVCTTLFTAIGVNYFQHTNDQEIGLFTELNDNQIYRMIHQSKFFAVLRNITV